MAQEGELRSLAQLRDLEVRRYRLTTRSHLRIGAGEGAADVAVENPIIRALIFAPEGTSERVPYIPGSSLHGVVRAWVEKALRSTQAPLSEEALKACVDKLSEPQQRNLLESARKEVGTFLGKSETSDEELYAYWKVYTNPHVCDPLSDVDKCERIADREITARDWKVAWWDALGRSLPCTVCNIFGYMGQRGRVKFTHGWPSTDKVPLDVITRVAINRLTGAADEGKLFDLEAIPPGVIFDFFVILENMDDKQKAHFDKGIRALNLQVAGLGAHGSVGFGMVDVERVFTAAIDPDVFNEDVEDFIATSLEGAKKASLDLDKVPGFFQALVVNHEKKEGKLLNGKITFTE